MRGIVHDLTAGLSDVIHGGDWRSTRSPGGEPRPAGGEWKRRINRQDGLPQFHDEIIGE